MNKKILTVVGITILFLGTCITPSVAIDNVNISSIPTSDKNVIIVDDEGDGDYLRIQDALNHANPGDTIDVYSGTYYEHGIDIIEERITLQGIPYELGTGHDTGKPFIDGRGMDYVFLFDANNIILDSFHIENWAGNHHDIIILSQNANECTISNNDLAHTSICFIYVKGSNNKIINNNISHSAIRQGILLRDPCSNCLVSGNTITYVTRGVECWGSNSNTITGNKISRCSEFGVDLPGGDYNTIEGNTFEYNTIGIHIWGSRGCRIKNNNFINNYQYQAYFVYRIPIFLGLTNRWRGNYWGEPRSSPYPIRGAYIFFPWVQFDWRPASEPYDI